MAVLALLLYQMTPNVTVAESEWDKITCLIFPTVLALCIWQHLESNHSYFLLLDRYLGLLMLGYRGERQTVAENTGKGAAKPHRLGGTLEASVCIWDSLYLPPALAVSFP